MGFKKISIEKYVELHLKVTHPKTEMIWKKDLKVH